MNEAEKLLRSMFKYGEGLEESVWTEPGAESQRREYFHPDVHHSLFGPSGTKEWLAGGEEFLAFVGRCNMALAARNDTILAITGIDEECAFVHAKAYRKSAASGKDINYEWAMLYRVENGQITYGADMLDTDAQLFWATVLQA